MIKAVASFVALAAFSACGADEEAAGARGGDPSRTDSAGVEIVENAGPAWAEGSGWRLAPTPRVMIGTVDGPDEEQLFRVFSATVLSDGRIAVANSGTAEIRYFDAEGRYLSATGGEGEGPGEFGVLSWLRRFPGDTLVAWDLSTGRLSRLGPAGEYIDSNTFQPPVENQSVQYVGSIAPDMHVVTVSQFPWFETFEDGKVFDAEAAYWLYDGSGVPVREIVRVSRGEQVMVTERSGSRVRNTIGNKVFTIGDQVRVTSLGLRVAFADRAEVRSIDPDDGTTRIVRYAPAPRLLTQQLIDDYLEAGDPTPDMLSRRRKQLDAAPLPEYLPVHGRLLVDAVGRAWLRPFGTSTDASFWTVIDENGVWLGPVEMPERFNPLEIGDDYVLGVTRDELGIEYLKLFDLEKGE